MHTAMAVDSTYSDLKEEAKRLDSVAVSIRVPAARAGAPSH
jgi:hypothetical protein